MKQLKTKLESIKKIKPNIYLIGFKSAYLAKAAKPGQFLHIKVDDKITILRRPFSIHKINKGKIYVLFKVRGRGTNLLAEYKRGDALDIIGPLGNGFKIAEQASKNKDIILVAGGIGVAPLLFLAQKLKKSKATVILGARNKKEIVCKSDFNNLGFKTVIATEDGSSAFKGTAPELLKKTMKSLNPRSLADIYVCGPKEMFSEIKKILKNNPKVRCQVSFEQFMGCGIGICCGCSIQTKKGYKKVCKDGPVFNIKEII